MFGLGTTKTKRIWISDEGQPALQVSYLATPARSEIERRHHARFILAQTEGERAKAVADFFREASPIDWPIADWAFAALQLWRNQAVGSRDAAARRDADGWFKTVAAVVVTPWPKRALADARKALELHRWRQDNQDGFDFDFYQKMEGAVSGIRKLQEQIEAKTSSQKKPSELPGSMKERASLLKEQEKEEETLLKEQTRLLESMVLDGEPTSGDWVFTFPQGRGFREIFEMGSPGGAPAQFSSAEDMLQKLLKGRLDRAALKLYCWLTGMDQAEARVALPKARKARRNSKNVAI